jgi:hypothetical protein
MGIHSLCLCYITHLFLLHDYIESSELSLLFTSKLAEVFSMPTKTSVGVEELAYCLV